MLPRVPFAACVERWAADEEMGDYFSAALGRRTCGLRRSRMASFPPFLMVQLKRCATGNAQPCLATPWLTDNCLCRHMGWMFHSMCNIRNTCNIRCWEICTALLRDLRYTGWRCIMHQLHSVGPCCQQGITHAQEDPSPTKVWIRYVRRYYVDKDWTAKKLEVLVDVPDALNLEHLRGRGAQPGEELQPEVCKNTLACCTSWLTAETLHVSACAQATPHQPLKRHA